MTAANNTTLSLKQLQDIARDYNEAHTPIPLKQPKAALLAQLEERDALDGEQGGSEERLARLIETVAREAAIYALKMEDRRRFYEAQERRSSRSGGRKRRRSAVSEEQ